MCSNLPEAATVCLCVAGIKSIERVGLCRREHGMSVANTVCPSRTQCVRRKLGASTVIPVQAKVVIERYAGSFVEGPFRINDLVPCLIALYLYLPGFAAELSLFN
jgi:hypothetical protein